MSFKQLMLILVILVKQFDCVVSFLAQIENIIMYNYFKIFKYIYIFFLIIVECVQLKIEEEHIEPNNQLPNVIKNEITFEPLKNGEVVNFRYFHDSTSVYVTRGSAEYSKLFNDVINRTFEDNCKF